MKLKIGSFYESNQCGRVEILNQVSDRYYSIKFENTGTIINSREDAIKNGCIRDPYAPLKCGVGCIGNISTKGKYKPYYDVWQSMIDCCYNPNNKNALSYKNVTVCDEWLTFENFYNDCHNIDGFNQEKFDSRDIVLDKDKKQRHKKEKIYSVETCTWISLNENSTIQDCQMNCFKAISPEGKEYISDNISAFAREHGLERKHISGVLHGRAKSTNNWKFEFINNEEIV